MRRCDFEACKALKAHEKSLVGRSITSLMSPMIAKFHDRYFRTLRTCPPEKFDAYRVQIERTMTKANHFVVYDCERNAMMCEVQVRPPRGALRKRKIERVELAPRGREEGSW